ncbi:hypothetical protein SDC9_120027 [bioreactor metagenome]|uniref:Uncharacterized protein n=1 Tax=bioreactor metagenome TaxID=1076179 RepID=A0A645C7N8_9ZZZZ
MVQHIIIEPVLDQRVVLIVVQEGQPVVTQFFWTEDQDGTIPFLVILDHPQCRKRLSESDAVGKNTSVVPLQLVDDPKNSIPLKVIELVPGDGFLETGSFVG